jgi:hypothetical protein
MSTPCTTCGEPLADDTLRCPTCGALASPDVDETRAVDQTRSLDDAPPWAIPIREPAPAPKQEERRTGPGRTIALAALALGVFVLTAVIGTRLLGDDDSDAASRDAGSDEVASPDERAGLDGDAVADTASTTSTSTSTTTSSTTETTVADATTTTSAPTTSVAPTTTVDSFRTAPNGTGSVPALSTSFRGWLAQLKSVPYDAGTAALSEEWERTRADAPGVVAARSSDWSAFGDGFWVLVDPGPFASPDEVRSFCESAGFTADGACLVRELRG